jgi:hypothetical protein
MTRTAINDTLWAAGMLAQATLLACLTVRRLAQRIPVFTTLIAFYLVRSLALFGLYGHIAPAGYAAMNNGFSIADLLLQMLVAGEIAGRLVRAAGGWTVRRETIVVGIVALAWAAAYAVRQMLPFNTPVPPDRLQMFDSLLMILLCAWALAGRVRGLVRRVAVGFGVYAAVSLVAMWARTVAAIHRDAGAYAGWSYAVSGMWVAVVVVWIFMLKDDQLSYA